MQPRQPPVNSNRVQNREDAGWITLSSMMHGRRRRMALSMANLSGPVRRPVVGSKYSITWKSLTWTWMGCSSFVVVDETSTPRSS